MPDAAVLKLSDLLDQTASDPSSDPGDRVASLRVLRADLASLVGQADRYIADQELEREGAAIGRVHDHLAARENAQVRSRMLSQGLSTPEHLDAAGLLDDDELDRRVADGTIEEMVWDLSEFERARELESRIEEATRRDPDRLAPAEDELSQPSTADVYSRTNGTGVRVYSASRKALHRSVIDGLLEGHEPQKSPSVTFTGADAAGDAGDAVVIDVPSIRRMLPEHKAMAGDPDQERATHDEAKDIAGQVEREARGRKLNVVMTGLASHQAKDMVSRVEQFRRAGYGRAAAAYDGDAELAEAMEPLGLSEEWSDEARAAALLARREKGKLSPQAAEHEAMMERIERLGLNKWPEKGEAAKRIFKGKITDTQQLHAAAGLASPGTGGNVYSAARKPLHDRIVGSSLAEGVHHLLGEEHAITQKLRGGGVLSPEEIEAVRKAAHESRKGEKPTALFMGGGSASGKSSALKAAPELVPHAAVTIDPDAIKGELPEYKEMVKAGDRYAASAAHEESSDIAKRVQQEARALGLNMVVDGTGDSKPGKFVSKIKAAHDAGYKVNNLYVTIPTHEAIGRSVKRAEKSGRFVPVPEVRTQHKNVSANFPDVAKLPFVNDLKVFDNRGSGPELIVRGSGGKVEHVNPQLAKEFLAKAHE